MPIGYLLLRPQPSVRRRQPRHRRREASHRRCTGRAIGALRHPASVPVRDCRRSIRFVWWRMAQRRLNMLLLGLFGVLGLAIAVVGIYGPMAYIATEQTREIGIGARSARRRGRWSASSCGERRGWSSPVSRWHGRSVGRAQRGRGVSLSDGSWRSPHLRRGARAACRDRARRQLHPRALGRRHRSAERATHRVASERFAALAELPDEQVGHVEERSVGRQVPASSRVPCVRTYPSRRSAIDASDASPPFLRVDG